MLPTLTCIKHLSEGAALLTGDASDAEEELAAVQGVGVLGEGAGGRVQGTGELFRLVNGDGLEAALGDLGDPEAAVGLTAVRQTGRTLVSDGVEKVIYLLIWNSKVSCVEVMANLHRFKSFCHSTFYQLKRYKKLLGSGIWDIY